MTPPVDCLKSEWPPPYMHSLKTGDPPPHILPLPPPLKFMNSPLEYCCSVWGWRSQEEQDKLIKLQKHAARLVLNSPRLTPSRLMFSHLDSLRFDKLVHLKQATLMHKSLNNLAPGYMSQMFLKSKGSRSSSENKLYVPRVHKNSLRFCWP